jgi:Xaa-Pro aminopeptidase
MDPRATSLAHGLQDLGCQALLVVAESATEPDLAPFLPAEAHLGQLLLVALPATPPRLAYLTPMERDEAERTGVALMAPHELGVARRREASRGVAAFLASLIEGVLEAAELRPGRIALAGHAAAGPLAAALATLSGAGWTMLDGGPLVATLRKRKTESELAGIGRASQATIAGLRAIAARLAATTRRDGELWSEGERLSIGRLRAELGRLLGAWGCEQPRGSIIAAGAESGVPHSVGHDERIVRAGESLVVDVFPRRGALFADCTRTFCVGEVPEPLARAHAAVREALRVARAEARPGRPAWELHSAVCRSFSDAGYPTLLSDPETTVGFVHMLGHGVGFELHEQPVFRREGGVAGELADGDVFTLEPGLYDPGRGYGVRLEDLCAFDGGLLTTLTPLPEALDPRAWDEASSPS